ncbi:nitroreductase family deazaflavin-dependent oxidoreductase [Nocardia cyriacigeorgica]|uniref:nitroreductase family deazaflavin-dependent oxidoreductase n=1 Tax=Nocardia cyriacigeorgica TaxID=135487 RepID=UPI0013D48041|nr:nitroreductase family deazaflavin-dependent oxidoreductase [Nocardia cyriacigeorgica]MBF6437615.1 nitroreductase family deazaflavin-dependent oxidoreductase [Nocardia cyriacigeorgica]MBF6453182.1 nitroreductase family deazaflavin-dependent oxidoreductase [Nocardia cyriacigeorgica]MBF6481577.1 nitroreductase family deazaflavin-dependent oxidoreductase [Nocardia cyriacigeorgica]MBF6550351.1 nitroreductase family deazaflavin-dependent oxidoreductase [Nocardia cyriacigeorgica]NEW28525.1 nitrore
MTGTNAATRYIGPARGEATMNRFMNTLPKLGISIMGSRLLAVRGRKSGQWRTTLVNVMDIDGARYLVAPRGHTQWVRNLRAAGEGELRLGRKVEAFTAHEIDDADKVPLLRAYLKRWGWEVGRFFEGVTKDATDAELAAIAPGFPVFRIA